MGSVSDEVKDISDPQVKKHYEIAYDMLKSGAYKIMGPDGTIKCPFCTGKGSNDYNILHTHAVARVNRSVKGKANHLALVTYLESDLANNSEPLLQSDVAAPAVNLEQSHNLDLLPVKINEKTMSIRGVLAERDELHQAFVGESRRLQRKAWESIERVLEEQETMNIELEKKGKFLHSWNKQLNKREALLNQREILIEKERQKFEEDRKKGEKEEALKRKLELQQTLSKKQKLEEKIREMKKQLNHKSHKREEFEVLEDTESPGLSFPTELHEGCNSSSYLGKRRDRDMDNVNDTDGKNITKASE